MTVRRVVTNLYSKTFASLRLCVRFSGALREISASECVGISKPFSTSILRSLPRRFELLRSSSYEKSAGLTNRPKQTKLRSWLQSMKSPVSQLVCSVRSKPTRRRRLEKKKPQKRKLAPQRDSAKPVARARLLLLDEMSRQDAKLLIFELGFLASRRRSLLHKT